MGIRGTTFSTKKFGAWAGGRTQSQQNSVEHLVRRFVEAVNGGDPEQIANFYEAGAHYYGKNNVSRRQIAAEIREYQMKWPHRAFSLRSAPERSANGDVRFEVDFEIRSGARRIAGVTEYRIRISSAGRIEFVTEEVVRKVSSRN